MEEKKNSIYYCIKCKQIPIIQIVPHERHVKIFSSCNCNKKFKSIDSFLNNDNNKNIKDNNKISKELINNNDKIQKNDKLGIDLIIDKFNRIKTIFYKDGNELKNKIIGIFQKKIEEINEVYNNYISNNNKIILIIEKLIKSYQIIKDNPTFIRNILNNCNFNDPNKAKILLNKHYSNIETCFSEIKNYFNKEYIISNSSIKEGFDINYFFYDAHSVKCFIELDNNICASCLKNSPNIILLGLDKLNKEKILLKADSKAINWMIKSNQNNLITCGNDCSIKIWPTLNEQLIMEKIKLNKNKILGKEKTKFIDLEPIFVYKSDIHEINKIEKMINLKGKQFLAISKISIFLFEYVINENNIDLKLIKNFKTNIISDLIDFYVIQKNKKEMIIIITRYKLYFLNIPNFEIINKMNVKSMSINSLIQLNKNEILVYEKNQMKIIDINLFKYKLTIKNNIDNDFILNINDGTFLQCSYNGIKRFLIKTMEELPMLYRFSSDDDNDSYNYENYTEKVVYLYMLKDKRIIVCFQNGKNEICKIK